MDTLPILMILSLMFYMITSWKKTNSRKFFIGHFSSWIRHWLVVSFRVLGVGARVLGTKTRAVPCVRATFSLPNEDRAITGRWMRLRYGKNDVADARKIQTFPFWASSRQRFHGGASTFDGMGHGTGLPWRVLHRMTSSLAKTCHHKPQ
jgi:hypothetical protein